MGDLVCQDGLDLILMHTPEEATADRDQSIVAAHSGREGIHLGCVKDRHLWHPDPGHLGLPLNGLDQPPLGRV